MKNEKCLTKKSKYCKTCQGTLPYTPISKNKTLKKG